MASELESLIEEGSRKVGTPHSQPLSKLILWPGSSSFELQASMSDV